MSFTIYSDGAEGSTWNGAITTGANTTWSSGSTYTLTPTQARATLVLDDVPVAARVPKTEVERLLAEVEEVCALAR